MLLAREFLYRQCELAANFSHDAVRYKELSEQQKLVLEAIGKLADADRTRAAAALLEVQTEAARLNLVQDADIAKVLAFVTAADGSLDRDAVKRLLDAAKLDPSFRSSIETRTTLADLQDYLQAVPDSVSRALAGAVPQKE